MKFAEDVLIGLNRLFPKRQRAGRESGAAYSEAQYAWAPHDLAFFSKYVTLSDKNVLDAGCGPGGKTVYYAEHGCRHITGLDRDPRNVELAQQFAQKHGVTNAEFQSGNLVALPFDADTFDLVLLNDVVEHIERDILIAALSECKRVIKVGGEICLNFPPWSSFDASHLYDHIYLPWCQVFFSDETLLNTVKRLNPNTTEAYIRHYRELNKLTIEEFKQIVRELGFEIKLIDQVTIKNIKLFSGIPAINKYLTRRVVAILSK